MRIALWRCGLELPSETLSEITRDFISYVQDQVSTLKHMLTSSDIQDDLQYQTLLQLHNMKGASSSLGCHVLATYCHNLEDLVSSTSFNYPAVRFELLEKLDRLPQIAVAESIEVGELPEKPAVSEPNALCSLLYISQRNEDVDADPEKILAASRKNNETKHITGALLFSGYFFIQVLEGDRAYINALFQKIRTDPRHQNVLLCHFGDLPKRNFGSWSMGYLADSQHNRELLREYTGNDQFQPYDFSANMLRMLMQKLSGEIT